MELCGGTPSENVVVGKTFGEDKIIDFPLSEIKRLAAIEVPLGEVRRILGHLGFMVAGSGAVVKIAVPSWRSDVHGKADIVEEIVRIVGVDQVPMTPFDRGDAPRKPILSPIQLRTRRAKRALAARGMIEAVTWSFIAKPAAELFGGGQPELALANPIASDHVRHAAEPAAGPGRGSAGQFQPRPRGRGAVRSRPGLQGRQAGGSTGRGVRRSPRLCIVKGHGTALVRLGDNRCARRQGRCVRGAGRRRRADAGAAGGARRRQLAASRDVPAPSRSVRKTCWAISASCIRACWSSLAPTAR